MRTPTTPPTLTEDEQARLTALWPDTTIANISKQLHLTPAEVRAAAKALGLPVKRGGRPPLPHEARTAAQRGCKCEHCRVLRRAAQRSQERIGKISRWMYYFNIDRDAAAAKVDTGANLRVELSRAVLRGDMQRLPNGSFVPKDATPSTQED